MPRVGVAYRHEAGALIRRNIPPVEAVEVTVDHCIKGVREQLRALEELPDLCPVFLHGVGLSLGTAMRPDPEYLDQVREFARRLRVPWYSEHLAFTKVPGLDLAQLLPIPRTEEALRIVCENVQVVQDHVGLALLLENISYYFEYPESEIGEVRLAAMVQGQPADERAFAELLRELDLQDHVIRVPFLPHWRVPEFLRACDVLCCLEQDFPIKAHAPLIAQEVLAAGRPALLSQEVAAKQPEGHRLAHGYNCWIIRDSTDHDEIARWLVHAIADPSAVEVGARGRIFVEHVQSQCRFPAAYEKALQLAVGGLSRVDSEREGTEGPGGHGLLDLLGLIRQEIAREAKRCGVTLPEASTSGAEWFHAARGALAATRPSGSAAATEQMVRLALQLFEAHREDASPHGECLFRIHGAIPRWRVDDLVECTPSLTTGATAQTYPSSPMDMVMGGDRDRGGPEVVVVILPFSTSQPVKVYVLSGSAAELVTACDGARTLSQLSHVVRWQDGDPLQNTLDLTEELFALGMLSVALPHDASRRVVMGAR